VNYNHIDYLRENIDSVFFNKHNGIEYYLAGYDLEENTFILKTIWKRNELMDTITPDGFLEVYYRIHQRIDVKGRDLKGSKFIYKDKIYKVSGPLRKSDERLLIMSNNESNYKYEPRYILISRDAEDYFKKSPKRRILGGST
jgi:hypothetical protein